MSLRQGDVTVNNLLVIFSSGGKLTIEMLCGPLLALMCMCIMSLTCMQDRVEVKNGRLRISNLALEDSGMYQCVAENKHGTVYSNAELRVQGEHE